MQISVNSMLRNNIMQYHVEIAISLDEEKH